MIKRYAWFTAALLLTGVFWAQTGQDPAAPATVQPQMTALKSTFVPGDKTIFYDDFTDMTADSAPPHFKIRGAAPELSEGGGLRQLSISQRGSIFPNLTALPKNFTFEAEVKVTGPARVITNLILSSKNKQYLHFATTATPKTLDQVASLRTPYQELAGQESRRTGISRSKSHSGCKMAACAAL